MNNLSDQLGDPSSIFSEFEDARGDALGPPNAPYPPPAAAAPPVPDHVGRFMELTFELDLLRHQFPELMLQQAPPPPPADHSEHLNQCALTASLQNAVLEAARCHQRTRWIIEQIRDFVLNPRGSVMIVSTIGQLHFGDAGQGRNEFFLESLGGSTGKPLGLLLFHHVDLSRVQLVGGNVDPTLIDDQANDLQMKNILAELDLILGQDCVPRMNGVRATLCRWTSDKATRLVVQAINALGLVDRQLAVPIRMCKGRKVDNMAVQHSALHRHYDKKLDPNTNMNAQKRLVHWMQKQHSHGAES